MASFIMAGRMQAAIFVVLSTLISLIVAPLIIFSSAAIALITLRRGWQQGIIYTLLASVTLVVVIGVLAKQPASSGFIAGLVTWLPIVATASVLAMTRSWNKTLQLILLLASAGVLLFHIKHPDASAYWKQILEQMKPTLLQMQQISASQVDEIINTASTWMTGSVAAAIAMMTVISLIIARNWQAQLYNPEGFGEEFRQIAIGKPAAIALLLSMVLAAVTKNQLFVELIMVGIGIFMFQGLSLVHSFVKQRGMNIRWLIGLYVLMFLILIQMIVLLASIGLVDNFANFRRQLTKQ